MTTNFITEEIAQSRESRQKNNPVELERHPIGLGHILAPTDLSSEGRKAVEYAVALAEQFNSQLTILHVYPPPHVNEFSPGAYDYSVADVSRQNAQIALDSLRSEIRNEYPRMDTLVRCGKPYEEIVAAAREMEVDLIVLSTHNYHWFSHLIHGSDAEGVLRHAPCPILIVRRTEQDFVDAK
jgi:universal stress protein A